MAVRTPANSALEDMGVVRNYGVSHERNSSFASGYFSATSALISLERNMESVIDQVCFVSI